MSERAQSLAERFTQVNGELIAAVEGLSDAQWAAACGDEGWPVRVTAHHVAATQEILADFVLKIATGRPLPPVTKEMIDQGNAEHARQFAGVGKAETLDLLRRSGAAAAGLVAGLADEQLDRSVLLALIGGAQMSAQQFAENVLIGHAAQHLASIRAACQQATA